MNADIRISVPAFVLLILALRPHWGRPQKLALIAALLLRMLRVGLITRHWQRSSARAEHGLAMGATLPCTLPEWLPDMVSHY